LISIGWSQEERVEIPRDELPATWNWRQPPLGLKAVGPSDDDPLLDAKIALGRQLFFDPVLSADGSMSCASCHRPDHGFASPDPVALGVGKARGERNAPSILNRALGRHLFWDGRAASLEEQALQPITNSAELANPSLESVLDRLKRDSRYAALFDEAFPPNGDAPRPNGAGDTAITAESLARALASFERTLVVGDSPVDQFRASDYASLTPRQRTGMWIFESRGKCWRCHVGDNFTDEQFHNTGVGFGRNPRDTGRIRVTGDERDRFAMKTPTLRGVAKTAPYMHDGSIASLREVVEFYNKGGSPDDPLLDSRMEALNLSAEELDALVDFLEALTPVDSFNR
jgi:cytochrome c peroxidase